MPNQIKIRPLKDKLRQFFSPVVYECSVFRNNGKPIGGFADENEVADAFSPTHSYVVGEPCIYENVVRICTTPHNGNWDASHFRSVSVMGYAQEIVKNLGMPAEYDPDYEYLVGDICTHDGLWYRSLYGYSGGGAGAWDATKWERVNSLDEIEALKQNLTDLDFASATEITPTAQGVTWTAPSMGYVSGFFRKNSNSTNASLINISSNKLDGKSKYTATLPQISGAYMPIDIFVVRGETLTFVNLLDINLGTGQSRLFFNPIIQRT